MASTAVTAAQAELISTLSQDEIPIKLRCAICSRLAVNAFRLPCCEQAICETCQSTLPSSCPVCEHTPVSAEDCKPNKSLRTTIKVFLRTEEKKREATRLKEAKNTPPITPVDSVALVIEAPTLIPTAPADEPTTEVQADIKATSPIAEQIDATTANTEDIEQPLQEQQDIPQPSIEEIAPGQQPIPNGDANPADDRAAENGEGQTVQKEENSEQDVSQTPGFGAGFGFDPTATGAFPNMALGGDFSQMQMMMSMQNGMAPNAFGAFPMMGMPGMGMDPMAMQQMQNMMMSGGFGGVSGMNGINGMGMGGFDGGVGTGFNTGWNSQQAWNVGQDNFNHPNAAGIGHGDYSSNNSGYNSYSAGYNQGNYGRGNQYNDYQNNQGYGYRGRGRGRGYSRGGYGYGSNDHFSQQHPQQFGAGQHANGPISETGPVPTGPKADSAALNPDVDEFGREIRHKFEAKDVAQDEASAITQEDNVPTAADTDAAAESGQKSEVNEHAMVAATAEDDSAPKPIQTLDEAEAIYGANGTYSTASSRGSFVPGFQGRGTNFGHMQPSYVKAVDVPINAPTGPKAMREGLPNTGLSSLRGRGFSIAGRTAAIPRQNGSASVAPDPNPSEKDGKERERSRSPSKEQSRSRERKRSRSRDRHSHRHRQRSTSLTEDDKETERRRQRRKERRRRHEEEGDSRDELTSGDKPTDEEVKEDRVDEERSRSQSPSDAKRSSHRSRRDKDKYRERDREDKDKYRDRDDDRDYKSSHKHRSSRRHHDDRSRSRDRSRERDREYRRRHSRRGSEEVDDRGSKTDKSIPPTPTEVEDPSRRPSIISTSAMGIEIKGASSRHKSTIVEETAIPTGPRSERTSTRDREKEKSSRHREEDDSRHRSSRRRDSDREREKERERAKEKERSRAPTTAPAVQDPHEAEREKRNRDRLLKEAQRMAGLSGAVDRKRSRDDGDELAGRKGRKKRGRGDETEEARVARLEAERESARWD